LIHNFKESSGSREKKEMNFKLSNYNKKEASKRLNLPSALDKFL